jgi:hypothetical protein
MNYKESNKIVTERFKIVAEIKSHKEYSDWMFNWIEVYYNMSKQKHYISVYEPDNYLLYDGDSVDEAIWSFKKSTLGMEDASYMREV